MEKNHKSQLKIGVTLMLISALFTSSGQLLWKLAEGTFGWFLILGFVFYGLGALLMITAFGFGELSKLHPVLCTSYIIALVLGFFVLGEPITVLKVAAIVLILVGVIFITGALEHD